MAKESSLKTVTAPMIDRGRLLFLANSALEYSARIQFMAEVAGKLAANGDFVSRTMRDISQEAAKLNGDLERLAKEIEPAN